MAISKVGVPSMVRPPKLQKRWGRKAAQRETKMHAREALVNSSDVSAEVEAWEEVMSGPLEPSG